MLKVGAFVFSGLHPPAVFEYPFVCPVIIFFLVFFFFGFFFPLWPHTTHVHLYTPPTHTHTCARTNTPSLHLTPTHVPFPCESPSARHLGSLVSSFVSSKNRSSQMSESRQTPTSSVQCKSHPRAGRVVPLSSPPCYPFHRYRKGTWSVVLCF